MFKYGAITKNGKKLIQQTLSGGTITFTRMEYGDGELPGLETAATEETLKELFQPVTALVNKKADLGMYAARLKSNVTNLTGKVNVDSVTESFYARELGVYAKVGDGEEVLFAYFSSVDYLNEQKEDCSNYISVEALQTKNHKIDVALATGNNASVDISYVVDVWVTKKDHDADIAEVKALIETEQSEREGADSGLQESIGTLSSNLEAEVANRKKAVTEVSISGREITVKKGDGTATKLTTQDTTYEPATTSAAGLMSAADKTKLDKNVIYLDNSMVGSEVELAELVKTYKPRFGTILHQGWKYSAAFSYIIGTQKFQSSDYTVFFNMVMGDLTNTWSKIVAYLFPVEKRLSPKAFILWTEGTAEVQTSEIQMPTATTSAAGLMSAKDKAKLDALEELRQYMQLVLLHGDTWATKTWSGLTSLYGENVWTDGDNIYYSNEDDQYILNKATSTWTKKTWSGLTSLIGCYIWTDGDNIYYSSGSYQYVLNKETSTWTKKTWSGLTSLIGCYIWTDGDHIYYSNSSHYVLPCKKTYTKKSFMGFGGCFRALKTL